MSIPKTIGFPRMQKEAGEKRFFLPEFIQFLANLWRYHIPGGRIWLALGFYFR